VNANGDGQSSLQASAGPTTVDNTMLFIGAGVVGVAIVAALAYFLMRRKK
jgi:LPXTG-motif cell wall-anchored protein